MAFAGTNVPSSFILTVPSTSDTTATSTLNLGILPQATFNVTDSGVTSTKPKIQTYGDDSMQLLMTNTNHGARTTHVRPGLTRAISRSQSLVPTCNVNSMQPSATNTYNLSSGSIIAHIGPGLMRASYHTQSPSPTLSISRSPMEILLTQEINFDHLYVHHCTLLSVKGHGLKMEIIHGLHSGDGMKQQNSEVQWEMEEKVPLVDTYSKDDNYSLFRDGVSEMVTSLFSESQRGTQEEKYSHTLTVTQQVSRTCDDIQYHNQFLLPGSPY